MSDTKEVLSKEEMYPLWLEMCPDKERLKEEFRKAFEAGEDYGGAVLHDSVDVRYSTPDFESWYQEFNAKITNGKC